MVTRHSLAYLATTGAQLVAVMVSERDVISTVAARWTIAVPATDAHTTQESQLRMGMIIRKDAAMSATTADRTKIKMAEVKEIKMAEVQIHGLV